MAIYQEMMMILKPLTSLALIVALATLFSCSHHEENPKLPSPDPDFTPIPGKPMPRTDSWGWIAYWDMVRYGGRYPSVAFIDPIADTKIISDISSAGSTTIGYLSIGSAEKFRDDYDLLKPLAPKKMSGWNEYWLDLNRYEEILPIMKKRLDEIKKKGFGGVYFDNFDVHGNYDRVSQEINEYYALQLVNYSREIGLTYVGANNGLKMLANIGSHFDFHINESCFVYNECHYFDKMVELNHPVFHLEYKRRNCKPYPGHSVRYLEDKELTSNSILCE